MINFAYIQSLVFTSFLPPDLFCAYIVEFLMVAKATGIGFLVMGFIGFFVKLIHIPVSNILM